MLQKRIYRRFSFDGNVACKTSDDRRRIVRAYLDDVSLGGVRLRSRERIPVNKLVHFAITSPLSKKPILGKGRVRHVTIIQYGNRSFLHGIKFERIKRHRIKELIKKTHEFDFRRKPLLSLQFKRELAWMFKLLPILILLTWLINGIINDVSYATINDRAYIEKVKDGLVYFLYHSK